MLEKAEEGSFFVRDSQSRPGCYALTMRVPQETSPSGFGNFLIVKVKDGVMIQVSTNQVSYTRVISEFTQQDGRKKGTAKRLSVTNVTGLLLACFVTNSLKIDVSYSSTKRSVQRNVKFGGSKAKAKLLSRLSHKVCRRLSSPVLLRKFTIIKRSPPSYKAL